MQSFLRHRVAVFANRTPLALVRRVPILPVLLLLAADSSRRGSSFIFFARAQSVPSAAPSPEPCPDQLAAVGECFAGQLEATARGCVSCVLAFWQSDASVCTDIDDETCAGLQQCSSECAVCSQEVLQYVQCLSGCDFECPADSPSPAAAPTVSASRCPDAYDAFNTCLLTPSETISECEACVVSFWPSGQLNACSEIEDDTCHGLTNCQDLCGECESEFVAYFECETSCTLDNTDCSSIPTAPSAHSAPQASPSTATAAPTLYNPCPDEYRTFNDCIGEGSDCEDCVIAYWGSEITSCSAIDDETCDGLAGCSSCAGCGVQFVTYLECLTKEACSWDCPASAVAPSNPTPAPAPIASTPTSATPSPTAPPSPTADPTSVVAPTSVVPTASSPSDECPEALDALDDCLSTQVTGAQRDDCRSCVTAAYDGAVGNSTCLQLREGVCGALDSECAPSCGDCRAAYETYLDCRLDADTIGCSLDCQTTSNERDNGSTSGAAMMSRLRGGPALAIAGLALWASHRLERW